MASVGFKKSWNGMCSGLLIMEGGEIRNCR